MMTRPIASQEFNRYANEYDHMLDHGLAVSGERKEYFAQRRIDWLKSCLAQVGLSPRHIMDYGCGTGMTAKLLHEQFDGSSIVAVDPSAKLIERAKAAYESAQVQFEVCDDYRPQQAVDLVYCNGVFHHIPVDHRAFAAQYVWRSLRPGGFFAFWENNPWNPGTQYIMSRIPFDRDAVTLTAAEACDLLKVSGFHVVSTDFLFIFPNCLSMFRCVEPYVSSLPFGAQYLVLGRKVSKG